MATDVNKYSTTREHLFKVLVIGEFGVGKTSIIRRYVEGYFSPNYKLTIGVDFALKTIVWDDETKVNLQLWDIAGHERFGHMTRVYYKYAIAAIIVFDLSRPATFDSITKWLNDVNSKVMLANEDPVPVMLLANKRGLKWKTGSVVIAALKQCDVENADVNAHKLADFCKSHNLIGWFATSAKDDLNIEEAMKFMIDHILKLPTENQQPQDHITLPQSPVVTSGTMYDESFETEAPPGKGNKGCCG